MASYYYLVASLPMVRFGEDPPISDATFLDACRASVTLADMDLIVASTLNAIATQEATGVDNAFLHAWRRYLQMFSSELNEQRARKLSLDIQRFRNIGNKDPWISDVVRSVMAAPDPLQAELLILGSHWKTIEALTGLHVFDVEVLIAWRLKAAISGRIRLFTPLEGNAEFKRLFSNLQTSIKSI